MSVWSPGPGDSGKFLHCCTLKLLICHNWWRNFQWMWFCNSYRDCCTISTTGLFPDAHSHASLELFICCFYDLQSEPTSSYGAETPVNELSDFLLFQTQTTVEPCSYISYDPAEWRVLDEAVCWSALKRSFSLLSLCMCACFCFLKSVLSWPEPSRSFNSSSVGKFTERTQSVLSVSLSPFISESSFRNGPTVSFECCWQSAFSSATPLPITVIICSMLEHISLIALYKIEEVVLNLLSPTLRFPFFWLC